MSQSSYEVVMRAIEMKQPDRLPVKVEAPVHTDRWGVLQSDVATVKWNFIGPGNRDDKRTIDEWGCLWERTEMNNMGQIKGHPLIKWDLLESYNWPDSSNPDFFEGMELQLAGHEDRYVVTPIFMFLFERMHALRGFQNCLTDFYEYPEKVALLADRIVEFNLGIIENIRSRFQTKVHGLSFTDDWGTQQAMMVNPRLWRNFFKPRYKILFDAIHAAGWHIWMHTDGKMNVILPDLIDLGLDVVNFQQPRVNGIKEIGDQFRGKICFESNVDIQATLPKGSFTDVYEEAQLLLEQWSCKEGGFILSIDENETDLKIPHQNILAMVDGFFDNDPWKKYQKEG